MIFLCIFPSIRPRFPYRGFVVKLNKLQKAIDFVFDCHRWALDRSGETWATLASAIRQCECTSTLGAQYPVKAWTPSGIAKALTVLFAP